MTATNTDTWASVEQIVGSPLADVITGNTTGRDMIVGGDGDDTLNGGGGGGRVLETIFPRLQLIFL